MKALIVIVLLALVSCKEEDGIDPNDPDQKGCMTGVSKSSGQRVNLRCCTQQEYLAGSNVNAGGYAHWTNYTQHEWKAVANCSACN